MDSNTQYCQRAKQYWEEKKNLGRVEPRFEPGTAGWEARTLPLCYAAPRVNRYLKTIRKYLLTASIISRFRRHDTSWERSNHRSLWKQLDERHNFTSCTVQSKAKEKMENLILKLKNLFLLSEELKKTSISFFFLSINNRVFLFLDRLFSVQRDGEARARHPRVHFPDLGRRRRWVRWRLRVRVRVVGAWLAVGGGGGKISFLEEIWFGHIFFCS